MSFLGSPVGMTLSGGKPKAADITDLSRGEEDTSEEKRRNLRLNFLVRSGVRIPIALSGIPCHTLITLW